MVVVRVRIVFSFLGLVVLDVESLMKVLSLSEEFLLVLKEYPPLLEELPLWLEEIPLWLEELPLWLQEIPPLKREVERMRGFNLGNGGIVLEGVRVFG